MFSLRAVLSLQRIPTGFASTKGRENRGILPSNYRRDSEKSAHHGTSFLPPESGSL